MMGWGRYREVLDRIFREVKESRKRGDKGHMGKLSGKQRRWAETLIANVENQKSVVAVVITSLLKKIVSPEQDVRLHREEFEGGYSGRSLDTNVVTPWLKEHFSRFAPKESGWLTRSIEQPHPFTMDFPGKIRNNSVKRAFLSILDDVEENGADPYAYLFALLYFLLEKYERENELVAQVKVGNREAILTIEDVIGMLREHFSTKRASRLPVVAIYTIYQIFKENVKIYEDKILKPLRTHTASDRYRGFGDIEIYNSDGTPFEIVEVKHNIPIDKMMIEDVLNKVKGTSVRKYYILTTAEPNFRDDYDELLNAIRDIKMRYGVEIIPNGIFTSLKYYLRIVPDLREFLDRYTENLKDEFRKSSDVKGEHLVEWENIIKRRMLA